MAKNINKGTTQSQASKRSKPLASNAKAHKRTPQVDAIPGMAPLGLKRPVGETITGAVQARTGNGLVVTTSKGRNIVVVRVDAEVNKLAKAGQPIKPLEAYLATQPKPQGKLAHGVDVHNSPHSAKAVRDNREAASAAGRKARGDAAAVSGKPAKAPKAKAVTMRGVAKTPQKMTILVKVKDAGLAVGSGREAKLAFAAKCKTTADFLGQTVTDAAGKVHKCDAGALSGMVKRGHVRLG